MRGDVKTHEVPPHGRIVDLYPEHGRIETADGRIIYFHRNSVLGDAFATSPSDSITSGASVPRPSQR